MRVTESRMLGEATVAVSEARSRAARAAEVMTSGRRVDRPSVDPAGWAQGARAAARQIASGERGHAIAHAQSSLAQSEDALAAIGNNLARAGEVAVQAANGTLNDDDRQNLVTILQGLREANLAAANRTGPDGEYLFAGSRGDVRPFDGGGNYLGDGVARTVESGEGVRLPSTIPGSVLTNASGGVNVLMSLDALITAVQTNDVAGMQAAGATITSAVGQVADARSGLGARMNALDSAEDARGAFEIRLAETLSSAVDADPIAAASELARSTSALDSARAVAQEVAALLRSSR
jgi:flagellar hook-associated protein 3 FlgL